VSTRALSAVLGSLLATACGPPAPDVIAVDRAAAEAFAEKMTAALVPCDQARIDAVFDAEQVGRRADEGREGQGALDAGPGPGPARRAHEERLDLRPLRAKPAVMRSE